MKKTGLGKGLSSLIPTYSLDKNSVNETKLDNNLIYLNINLLKANINQPRKLFDNDSINDLSDSIKNHGVIQPILVNEENGYYLIIAGERRFRAAKKLGFEKIPCIITNKTTQDILEISLIENIQRKDLNPIEEALAFKNLISNFKLTQDQLSKRLSISRVSITNKLRLLKLSKIVQDYILNEDISEGHGRALIAIENDYDQITIANKILDENLSVRETEKLIKSLLQKNDSKQQVTNLEPQSNYMNDLKYKLENYFGTKVSINNNHNKGKIQIEYYSVEDLDRILNLIYLDQN